MQLRCVQSGLLSAFCLQPAAVPGLLVPLHLQSAAVLLFLQLLPVLSLQPAVLPVRPVLRPAVFLHSAGRLLLLPVPLRLLPAFVQPFFLLLSEPASVLLAFCFPVLTFLLLPVLFLWLFRLRALLCLPYSCARLHPCRPVPAWIQLLFCRL